MFLFLLLRPPRPTLFPYTTLFRSAGAGLLAVPRALPSPLVPVPRGWFAPSAPAQAAQPMPTTARRSEEHTSELQSRGHLVCRLLLEKKNRQTENLAGCSSEHRWHR